MPKKQMKYPKLIYVQWAGDDPDNAYLSADAQPSNVLTADAIEQPAGSHVAVYEFSGRFVKVVPHMPTITEI